MAKGRKTGGRKKGSLNASTGEVRAIARKMVDDPAYRASLNARMLKGNAGPVEVLVWHYAYGRPTETHEHSGPDGGPILYKTVDEFYAGLPTP